MRTNEYVNWRQHVAVISGLGNKVKIACEPRFDNHTIVIVFIPQVPYFFFFFWGGGRQFSIIFGLK